MTKEEINNKINFKTNRGNPRKVICITTMEVFDSATIASKHYNIACIQKRALDDVNKSSGKLEDGTKLHWMYYDEYLKLNKDINEAS